MRRGHEQLVPVQMLGSKPVLCSRAKVTFKWQEQLQHLECCKDFVYFKGKFVARISPQALK